MGAGLNRRVAGERVQRKRDQELAVATFDDRLISHSAGKDYDVIIVGAGPAGLSFARSLATWSCPGTVEGLLIT